MKFPQDGKTMKKALKHKWPAKGQAISSNDNDVDDIKPKKKITSTPAKVAKKLKKKSAGAIKHTGKFDGKSNALGHGGRAAQMRAQGVPQGVIGAIARREGAAPGGPNYHGKKK